MQKILHKIHSATKAFRDDTRGTVAIEAVIMMPVLFWAFMSMAIFFDMYRAKSTTEKAAFTISDILSRETSAIDENYMSSVKELYNTMSTLDDGGELRVSVLAYNADTNQYFLDWSYMTGMLPNHLTDDDLLLMEDKLPILVSGERLILVETFGTYEPAANIGTGDVPMDTFVFTRPRFAPQLVWDGA
ncbi:MAG: TadE/TadG family type IV pilus assembly protein [Shimia sp.]|jgi:hypothetical protein|uniref:TadE/TadG family type IV pilus assembly protein n=1 Tax=Shimia sp. TaxID=1954381 RepID=UPI004058537D